MHNNARYILFIIIAIIFMVMLTSCEDNDQDEQEQNSSVIGSWLMTNVIIKDTPVGNLTMTGSAFLGMSGTGALTSTLTLNEDGSASVTTTYESVADEVEPGTWSQDGDFLVITGAGIDDTVAYELLDNTLTLTVIMQIDFAGDGFAEDTEVDMTYTAI